MKTYIKDCLRCGVVFEAHHHNVKLCSEECKTENRLESYRRYYANIDDEVRERKYERNRVYHKDNRDKISQRAWENQQHYCASLKEEARALKPVLDGITFLPENVLRIESMVDYIELEPRLAKMLDWYWLSDAKEYLDEQQR